MLQGGQAYLIKHLPDPLGHLAAVVAAKTQTRGRTKVFGKQSTAGIYSGAERRWHARSHFLQSSGEFLDLDVAIPIDVKFFCHTRR